MKKKVLNSPKQVREEDIILDMGKLDAVGGEVFKTIPIEESIAKIGILLEEKSCRKDNSRSAEHIKNDEQKGECDSIKNSKSYKFNNSKYDKAVDMFVGAFSACIKDIDNKKANELSYKIVEYIIAVHLETFPKTVRSKSHNLKENTKLCNEVYNGNIGPKELVEMSIEDMQTDDLRDKNNEYIKDSLLSSQIPIAVADTEIFLCGKCKQRKCTYYQLQTRSCDEPMTTFVTCTVCANKWKF